MTVRRRFECAGDMRIISFWRRGAHFRGPVATSPDESGIEIAGAIAPPGKPMHGGGRRVE
jgi:hypothetical protein